MANKGLDQGNPLYVDTVAAVQANELVIDAILWVNDETAGDDIAAGDFFELTSTDGGVIICSKTAIAAGDDMFISFPSGLKVLGVTCSSIDGGIAFVYVRSYQSCSF